jgi:hypothetical protein
VSRQVQSKVRHNRLWMSFTTCGITCHSSIELTGILDSEKSKFLSLPYPLLEKNESQEKTDELRKEIEREISSVKYTGYKSSNLESLISEYRKEVIKDFDWSAMSVGFTLNASSWIVKSADYVYQKLFG